MNQSFSGEYSRPEIKSGIENWDVKFTATLRTLIRSAIGADPIEADFNLALVPQRVGEPFPLPPNADCYRV